MKKLLFLTFAIVLGMSVHAQPRVLKQVPNRMGNAQLFTPYKGQQPKKIDPAANQVWWGYGNETEKRSAIGISRPETYDVAFRVAPDNSAVVGKTIKAIRIYLRDKANTKDVKVWISKGQPSDVSKADYVQNVAQSSLKAGDESKEKLGIANDIALTKPYVIGSEGVYVGYSFTITKVSDEATQYPIVSSNGNKEANSIFLRTSKSIADWSDYSNQNYGKTTHQILIEGNLPQNSVSANSLEDIVVAKNTTRKTKFVVTNTGIAGISSIDYTVATNGTVGAEQHLNISPAFKPYAAQYTIELPLAADANTGITTKTVTITKVNGKTNEASNKTATCQLTTVAKEVKRGVVVEEFTGTGCGWCPRGWVGMKKMREQFGENFVGVALHKFNPDDPMYYKDYDLAFNGAPACKIDRNTKQIDPYYGSEDDVCDDFKKELSRLAAVGISGTCKLNAARTEVTATTTIEPVANGTYDIAYVLVADGLTGTTDAWKQSNYFVNYNSSQLPADLAPFGKGGKYGTQKVALVYDDVVLATSFAGTKPTLAPLQDGNIVTNTYTLKLPTKADLKAAIDKTGYYNKLAVVAMLIRKDGRIENAAKFYLPDPAGVEGISENKGEVKEVARYTIDGRRISAPQRGLNIVKMSDGSTVKVLVK
ncbi:hemin-binding protein [Prevotella falsenii]